MINLRFCLAFLLLTDSASQCQGLAASKINRRVFLSSTIATTVAFPKLPALSADEIAYETRNRNKNKDALVREDYWYMTGKKPPRSLDLDILPSFDPKFNAWGACDTASGNACTYVSLKQKIPAYSKYAFIIQLGAKEFGALGKAIQVASSSDSADAWDYAASYLIDSREVRSPAIDALLKMVLMATSMLTSPNYTGPPFELLVSRFYVNETAFAISEISSAIASRDAARATSAWEFGKDSWNSYLTIVNRAIVPKVGEKIPLIA